MQQDDQESPATPLRIGGWVPPASPGRPAAQAPGARPVTPLPEPRSGTGGRPTGSRAAARTARRRVALRRSGRRSAAVTIIALAATGVLVASISRIGSPATSAQLPALPLPWSPTPVPASAAAVALPPGSPTRPPDPTPSRSLARPEGSVTSFVPAARPSASRSSPAPPAAAEPAPATPFRASYEAESQRNVLGGQTRPLPRDDASAGLVVRFVGNGPDNFLRFVGVTVPEPGTYNVRVQYISGEPRPAMVLINGRAVMSLVYPASPDWYTVAAVTLRLPLDAGPNTIEFRNDTAWAPDFDRIDLTR
ncbi:hypothetical protein [Couchioplanes caeruleus]|uniref:CBM6 domain-containing protein n=1 Tax=Couchioplanes caeruleus TaxID=56438 RepID=A0A3N1GI13_9ACTN|nr:hypothetical protein [Couchioplanes caeruleus]ROP29838.1 hypothetical protein EDD30_2658 [Couchioplanes caeruleus]